jgi:hypothetical protein
MGVLQAAALVCALLLPLTFAQTPLQYSITGCLCIGTCERTIDSPFRPWCYTSQRGIVITIEDAATYCGRYSLARQAFWDECMINTTTIEVSDTIYLGTFDRMWSYITIAATAATAASYCIMGCAAAIATSPRRTLWWLPCASVIFGGCHGFIVGAGFAAIVSFMYLSLPYEISVSVAVSLGIGVAALLTYGGLGRYRPLIKAPHASEYDE